MIKKFYKLVLLALYCIPVYAQPPSLEKRIDWWEKHYDKVKRRSFTSEDSIYMSIIFNQMQTHANDVNEIKENIADLLKIDYMLYIAGLDKAKLWSITKKNGSISEWEKPARELQELVIAQKDSFIKNKLFSAQEIDFALVTFAQFLQKIR